MFRKTHLVLDEYLPVGTRAYSHARFNHPLGAFDQIGFMALLEPQATSGAGQFDLWISESGDARIWVYGNHGTLITTPGATGDITFATGFSSMSGGVRGYDGTTPAHAFMRIEVLLTTLPGRVKVYAVQRDQGG